MNTLSPWSLVTPAARIGLALLLAVLLLALSMLVLSEPASAGGLLGLRALEAGA